MPVVSYDFKFRKNSNIALSPEELENLYFFGIPIVDASGNPMPEESIRFFIESAQDEVEQLLNLKLFKEIIVEDKDFYISDYRQWGFIRLTYMCMKAFEVESKLGGVSQIKFPEEWLSSRKTSDGQLFNRSVHLVPSHNTAIPSSIYYLGRAPIASMGTGSFVPQYNTITYCTGFGYVPIDIQDVIGKMAAINIYHQLGDLILGAGIAGQELRIDGLHQEIQTTSSATNSGYGARIIGYERGLKEGLQRLISFYRGPVITVL